MTQSKARAIGVLLIWGLVTVVYLFVFFGGGGPASYLQERSRILYMAILFGLGYAAHFVMLFATRVRPGGGPMGRDERDASIARRSNGAALVVVLVYVFTLCIALYEIYHDRQSVPVGWMWFLGYTSVFVGYICHAVSTLLLHGGVGGHDEG